MHIITIPKAVEVTVKKRLMGTQPLEKSETVTFQKFLIYACEGYALFAKGPKQARQYDKLMGLIEKMKPKAKTVAFEAGDYEILEGAVKSAEWGVPDVNRQYIPFYDAFENPEIYDTPQDVKTRKTSKKK